MNKRGMFGVSGTALGMVLRAIKKDYKEIAIVGLVYGAVVFVLTVIASFIAQTTTTWTLEGTLSTLSVVGPWITGLALGSWAITILAGITFGIAGFISLMLGAIVVDISNSIIKSI